MGRWKRPRGSPSDGGRVPAPCGSQSGVAAVLCHRSPKWGRLLPSAATPEFASAEIIENYLRHPRYPWFKVSVSGGRDVPLAELAGGAALDLVEEAAEVLHGGEATLPRDVGHGDIARAEEVLRPFQLRI